MAISVACPHCGQVMAVKEANAGKKARCPKCNGAMQLPQLAAAPTTRKVVTVVSVPAAAEDEADEPTKPTRKRRRDDDDDDEDDAPLKQRKPKRSALPTLAVIGSIFFLLAGGVLLFMTYGSSKLQLAPGVNLGQPNAKFNEAAAQLVMAGMTLEQVEELCGPGHKPTPGEYDAFRTRHEFGPRAGMNDDVGMWELNADRGLVLAWSNLNTTLLLVFDRPPTQGGRVIGRMHKHPEGSISVAYDPGAANRPPPGAPMPNGKNPLPNPDLLGPRPGPAGGPNAPIVTTPDAILAEFAADPAAANRKYAGKRVQVTGKVTLIVVSVVTLQTTDPNTGFQVRLDAANTANAGKYKEGDIMTTTGQFAGYFQINPVLPNNRKSIHLEMGTID